VYADRSPVRDINRVSATIVAPKDTEQAFRDELDVMFERRGPRFFGTGEAEGTDIAFEDSHHDKRYYLLLVITTSTGIKLGRDWLHDRAVRPSKLEQIVPTIVKKVRQA
jgi:RNA 3'-terminal phosphate cyclase (ATP)